MTTNIRAFLSIVIPVFNEAKRISNALKIISSYLNSRGYTFEIIVVDDGGKDGSFDLVKDFMAKNRKRIYY